MCLWHRAVRTVRELMAQPASRWTRQRLCRAGRSPAWVYFNRDLYPFPRCSQPQQCRFSILIGPSPALIAAGPAPAKHLCLQQPGKPLAQTVHCSLSTEERGRCVPRRLHSSPCARGELDAAWPTSSLNPCPAPTRLPEQTQAASARCSLPGFNCQGN